MDLAAIVVNFRTAEPTVDAVTALLREMDEFEEPRVVVVDNDSRDGSFEQLTTTFADPAWRGRVTVIDSGHNGGYGYGINVGVRFLLALPRPPRHVYVINPDAVVEPGSLKRMMAFMDSHPDVGLVGGRIYNPSGTQVKAFRFPSFWGEFESTARTKVITRLLRAHMMSILPTETCEVDWVSGTSMLIRTEVLRVPVLFDEGFFLYFEEIDFARRVRHAGWKVFYVEDASVAHIGSLATGMMDESRPMPGYWFQARRRYFVKHHGLVYGAACDLAWICGYAVCATKSTLLRRRIDARPRMWRNFIGYSVRNLLKPAPEAEQNAGMRQVSASETQK
jgi:GT2 family glycosyltransferase